jgi:hypothetical protein
MAMSSRERMHAALTGRETDRPPIALMLDVSYLCRATGIDLREFEHDGNAARAGIQVRFRDRHPENDMIVAWNGVDRAVGTRRKLSRDGDRFFVTDIDTGTVTEIAAPLSRFDNLQPSRTSEISAARPIEHAGDIDRVMEPYASPEQIISSGATDVLDRLAATIGSSTYLAFRPGEVWQPVIELLGGFERAMEMLATDTGLVAAVAKEYALRKVPLIQASARSRPDAVVLTAYVEGPDLISPATWRAAILPAHRIMAEEARRHGLRIVFWVLGACLEHIDDLCGIGVDALMVEQSRCSYSCDPLDIRRVAGDRLCVFGWTPELAMIQGDRDEVSRVVERQLKLAGPGGPFGMSTTFLTDEVAPEMVDFFCREVLSNGALARGARP